jgi:hypothetical protein
VTDIEQEPAFPDVSVAVNVTRVTPTGNGSPLRWVAVTTGDAVPASYTVGGGKRTGTPPFPGTVRSEGQTMDGGVVSTTLTWNVQLDWLPASSLAVAVTVETPMGKGWPGSLLYEMAGFVVTESTAVTS